MPGAAGGPYRGRMGESNQPGPVSVASLTELAADRDETFDGLAAYYAIDGHAWGVVTEPAEIAAKRKLADPDRFYIADVDGSPAGVLASYAYGLTLPGGATVDVAGVTDVGVVPTHRRRGALTSLMARSHADDVARGEVGAVLNASETVIYRRFGYGIATHARKVTVHTAHARFHPDWSPPPGRVQMLSRSVAHESVAAAHEGMRRDHAGWLTRSPELWNVVLGDAELWIGGGRSNLALVHVDTDGHVDGVAIYKLNPGRDDALRGSSEIEVSEIWGVDDATELALWRVLLDHDLVGRVTAWVPIDSVLPDALADPRAVVTSQVTDHLWFRILDIPAVLSARTYATTDDFVIDVIDGSRPDTGGRFRLHTSGSGGTCERVPAGSADGGPVDVRLDVADLASLAMGGASAQRMLRVGRLHPTSRDLSLDVSHGFAHDTAARLDAAFRIEPVPWCFDRF